MPLSQIQPIGLVWLAAFLLVSLGSALYFWLGQDADSKRQFYPWVSALTGVLFLGFAYFAVHAPGPIVAFMAAFMTLGSIFQVRRTTFCPRCARMIYRGAWLTRVTFCPRCGQALDASHAPP